MFYIPQVGSGSFNLSVSAYNCSGEVLNSSLVWSSTSPTERSLDTWSVDLSHTDILQIHVRGTVGKFPDWFISKDN